MKVKSESEVAQSCPTPSDPMDCSPPGPSVHGFFQGRLPEWGAIAFSLNMLSIAIFNSSLIVLKSKTVRSKMVVTSYIQLLSTWNTASLIWDIVTVKCMLDFEDLVQKNCPVSHWCWEPAWGTLPMAKVMRKEVRHMQRQDWASGVPLEILEHLPPKPESTYFTALCSHLHLWLYGGLSPTTSLWKRVSLQLVFQPTNSFGSPLACLNRFFQPHVIVHSLPTVEARDVLNCLNTDSFEQLEDY